MKKFLFLVTSLGALILNTCSHVSMYAMNDKGKEHVGSLPQSSLSSSSSSSSSTPIQQQNASTDALLLQLPDEILLSILDFVVQDPDFCQGVKHLLTAGRVCKDLRRLTKDRSLTLEKLGVMGRMSDVTLLADQISDIVELLFNDAEFIAFVGKKNIPLIQEQLVQLETIVQRYQNQLSKMSAANIRIPAEIYYLCIKLGRLVNAYNHHLSNANHQKLILQDTVSGTQIVDVSDLMTNSFNPIQDRYARIMSMFERRDESIRQRLFSVRVMNFLKRVGRCLLTTGRTTVLVTRKTAALGLLLMNCVGAYRSLSWIGSDPDPVSTVGGIFCAEALFGWLAYKLWFW